ncbi:MAG: hypothetical protein IJ109_06975 [Firmicutes bacterium]|nr:hypothetical protein [Bacillota bacterium]
MKKKLLCILMTMVMMGSMAALTSCGGSEGEFTNDSQQEVTEETVHAADPMTDEEMQNDDSEGCIEDSEDLLY